MNTRLMRQYIYVVLLPLFKQMLSHRVSSVVGINTDLSEIYHLAELGRMSSHLLHDLANTLTVATLNLESIQYYNNRPIAQAAFSGVSETENRISTTLLSLKQMNQMLRASKRQIQQQTDYYNFDLLEEIRNVLVLLRVRADVLHIVLDFSAASSQEKLRYYGNPVRFAQMITNLVTNALDAYEEIPVKLKKKRQVTVTVKKSRRNIMITVQDYAQGISAENLKHIFQPFFTTKVKHGTGLGLSLVKNIVEQELGGNIEVKTQKGRGTTFVIEFPLLSPHASAENMI